MNIIITKTILELPVSCLTAYIVSDKAAVLDILNSNFINQ